MAPPPTRGTPGAPRPTARPSPSRASGALRSAGRALSAKKAAAPDKETLHNTEMGDDADEVAAFARKHAADLEEESRRHVSGETASELSREELERQERLRRKGWNFDERRKKRGRQSFDEDEQSDAEEAEAEAKAKRLVAGGEGPAPDAAPPEDRMGDETLTDPNEMKRVLGASARFAQHAMLLAEERLVTGATRGDAVAFLAGLYVGLEDRSYAQKALRAFGPGTGILDIYPLEVVEHLLQHVPGFFDRAARAPLFGGKVEIEARPGEAALLDHDPKLRVRGFAVGQGARPGYRFEPDDDGRYRLTLESEGRFTLLVSAVTRDGALLLDELEAHVHPAAPSPPEVRRTSAPEVVEAPAEPSPTPTDDPKRLPTDLNALHFPRRI